ncbi:aminotransferase class I/II-fold pyridoxal phosphate-dependent enzyme (plasmid) [Pseudoalteromonas xiamenensis]|uniref:pyridoxal phosphate-dependent decarboxylase family protein n=1 Tax=Pseudoalteromonas xiamenensis TaxID=882626 RepID=UPI0027E3FBC3|nr:aminotransferase class I/II-fold pyridoxal phosphate-dependent enzyme [Pseudoalteromonas xiamenensis]WMN61847.1 aminotransferase class I/II-fold pyridoxal phosphate-dependent enzyme [Pseudoalteromonas xiamenensis]
MNLISALAEQLNHQGELNNRPVVARNDAYSYFALPESGLGFSGFCTEFRHQIEPRLSGSNGPRYWGFVTGGANPTATYADWLVTCLNQNVAKGGDSAASNIERLTLKWLTELFELPNMFDGVFTTGATSANVLGALVARQYAGQQRGINVALDGFYGVETKVLSATPHASMVKALGFAGFGQKQWEAIKTKPNSEALALDSLISNLKALKQQNPKCVPIVIASAGTVTGTDYDDLDSVAKICREYKAWLHVDAAFGIFERLVEGPNGKTKGLEYADSITLDCHKWLNVPYDCGVFLTRHLEVLKETCHVDAPYLANEDAEIPFMSIGIENSRRFRALPVFATLLSYGRDGVRAQIMHNIKCAEQLANWIRSSEGYELVKECLLNVVLFKPKNGSDEDTRNVLKKVNQSGKVFMTPGRWQGQSVIRAAFSNWRTTDEDVEIAVRVLSELE